MYLLDTNVVSELRKAGEGKADPCVTRWQSSVDTASMFISAVTLMELEIGILSLQRRDVVQASMLRNWLNRRVLAEFRDRTLVVDGAVALRSAQLHVPDRRPDLDALIAGTALVHGMKLVTRNVADFAGTGVVLLNPWEPQ